MDRRIPFPLAGDGPSDSNFRVLEQQGRGDIIVGRRSKVAGVITVGPDDPTGGFDDGNTRFAVKHGLGDTPDYTHVYVKAVSVASDCNPPVIASNRSGMSGADKVPFGLICINSCHPYADKNYSYFTVAFPCAMMSSGGTLDANGEDTFVFDGKWGPVRDAFATGYNLSGSSPSLYTLPTGQTVLVQDPIGSGAAGATYFLKTFFSLWPGTLVTVECRSVIGEVWDRVVTAGAKTDIHPVTFVCPEEVFPT